MLCHSNLTVIKKAQFARRRKFLSKMDSLCIG